MQRWLRLMQLLPTNSAQIPACITTRLQGLSLRVGSAGWDARSLYLRDLRFDEGHVYPAQPTYEDLQHALDWLAQQTPHQRQQLLQGSILYLCNKATNAVCALTLVSVAGSSRLVVVLNSLQQPSTPTRDWLTTAGCPVQTYKWVNL